ARVVWVGGSALAVLGLTLVLYWPWLAGVGILTPAFDEISGKFNFHSVPGLVQRWVADWLPAMTDLRGDAADATAQLWVASVCHAAFVFYFIWELMRVWSSRDQRPAIEVISSVSARALLVALLLVLTEVHTWYFTWPLVLVTLLGWRSTLTRLVVGYTLTC